MNLRKYHDESTNVSIVSVSLLAQQPDLGEGGGGGGGGGKPVGKLQYM